MMWLAIGFVLGWIVRVQIERRRQNRRLRAFIKRDVAKHADRLREQLQEGFVRLQETLERDAS